MANVTKIFEHWRHQAAIRQKLAGQDEVTTLVASCEFDAERDELVLDAPEKRQNEFEVFDDLEDSVSRERRKNLRRRDFLPLRGFNLKSLMRWLRAHVGQTWNEVWSKLVQHPHFKKMRKEAQRLVPSVTDASGSRWSGLYRDEADVVCLKPEEPKPPKPQPWQVDLSTGEVAVCVKGVYYAFTTQMVERLPWTVAYYYSDSSEFFRGKVGDYFCKGYQTVRNSLGHSAAPVIHQITAKRQLGHADLRAYGLRK